MISQSDHNARLPRMHTHFNPNVIPPCDIYPSSVHLSSYSFFAPLIVFFFFFFPKPVLNVWLNIYILATKEDKSDVHKQFECLSINQPNVPPTTPITNKLYEFKLTGTFLFQYISNYE